MINKTNIIANIIFFQVNGTYILKSGTDFRQFSLVTLDFREVIFFPYFNFWDSVTINFREVIFFPYFNFWDSVTLYFQEVIIFFHTSILRIPIFQVCTSVLYFRSEITFPVFDINEHPSPFMGKRSNFSGTDPENICSLSKTFYGAHNLPSTFGRWLFYFFNIRKPFLALQYLTFQQFKLPIFWQNFNCAHLKFKFLSQFWDFSTFHSTPPLHIKWQTHPARNNFLSASNNMIIFFQPATIISFFLKDFRPWFSKKNHCQFNYKGTLQFFIWSKLVGQLINVVQGKTFIKCAEQILKLGHFLFEILAI